MEFGSNLFWGSFKSVLAFFLCRSRVSGAALLWQVLLLEKQALSAR